MLFRLPEMSSKDIENRLNDGKKAVIVIVAVILIIVAFALFGGQ